MSQGTNTHLTSEIFIHLSVNARRSNQHAWGDTQFAEGLAKAIRSQPGCNAGLVFRGENVPATQQAAILLRIVGPHLEDPVPGLPNILWMISPPTLAPTGQLRRYQAIFCGGLALTKRLESFGLNVHYLPQATDTAHFHPNRCPSGTVEVPLVFVGGYAQRVDRRLVLDAVKEGLEPQIWGPGWKGVIPERLWQGERLGYTEIAQLYARSRIILNSHMSNMAAHGFMSNRSYDALASGAKVISDLVVGFADPELPEIWQVRSRTELGHAVEVSLASPPASRAERIAQHDRLVQDYSFDARAKVVVREARMLLGNGQVAPAAFRPANSARTAAPLLSDPGSTGPSSLRAVAKAAREILSICAYLERPDALPLNPPEPTGRVGVIHALMADLREAQRIACAPAALRVPKKLEALATRARRIVETFVQDGNPLGFGFAGQETDSRMERILRNEPLWAHTPEGYDRDNGKINVPIWPRRQVPTRVRTPGVFLHLYYDDLAPVLAERLQHITAPFDLYVSTDTPEKSARIQACLPDAEIRVLENRGRDIWPKLYGFGDVYHRHETVLHLHGKKSSHSGALDHWFEHILDCLIGSETEVNRILSLFDTIPQLGIVTPVTFKSILSAAHWGANRGISRELAWRMKLDSPLPDDSKLRFPAGSMFWARTAAIQSLLDLNLRPEHFPPEAGQVDGTLAHAIERMLGVACRAKGFHILPVAGTDARLHRKYQRRFTSNGELRAALEAGVFDA